MSDAAEVARNAVRGWLTYYLPAIKSGREADSRFHEARRAIYKNDAFSPVVVNDAGGNPRDGMLVYDDDEAGKLIDKALGGDPDADHVIKGIAADFLRTHRALPSPRIAEYVANSLENKGPALKAGRKRNDDRILSVAAAVQKILDLGLGIEATRGHASRDKGGPASACALVAEVLGELGYHIAERSVEDLWNERPGN